MQFDFREDAIVSRAAELNARIVVLQFPEGLMCHGFALSRSLRSRLGGGAEVVVLGDAAYGACCLDDHSAGVLLKADLLIHFGHSRLIDESLLEASGVSVLHVPVSTRSLDAKSVADEVTRSLRSTRHRSLALVSTAQFVEHLHDMAQVLRSGGFQVTVPSVGCLRPGEILGCTAPTLDEVDAFIFVGDGRFHVEAVAIANPTKETFRFDPYTGVLSLETHDCQGLWKKRREEMEKFSRAKCVGIAYSTLGRQACRGKLAEIEEALRKRNVETFLVLMSDVSEKALSRFKGIDAWVQLACPRLSLDWSSSFPLPILTHHEALLALCPTADIEDSCLSVCPMDNWCRPELHK